MYLFIFREKRLRFPKGKKLKQGDQVPVVQKPDEEEDVQPETEAQIAARERALRRKMNTLIEEDTDMLHDISVAEVQYKVCSSHSICIASWLIVQKDWTTISFSVILIYMFLEAFTFYKMI